MRHSLLLAAGLLTACAGAQRPGTPSPSPIAEGPFRDAGGERVGVATLSDTAGALRLAVSVAGLTPGPHGIHVHAQGACTPPAFTSAGAHFNPDGRKHGRLNPDGPHLGDLPNLLVGPDGSADTSFVLAGAETSGPRSLVQPGGTSVVIHAGPDDERTDPSGGSGERVACAVLEPG
ncbi:MAG TPA: superoxide dismutase family protein [Gemmatimonadales bacterium]|jgi:Cu-Zn family superoxide dismutase|nr:superoxide dismutase family protein [Gemmatimonadales bacterium]